MANGNGFPKLASVAVGASDERPDNRSPGRPLHPAWQAFVRYCEKLQHGDIERLRIQNGLPVLVEVATKKIKFS